MVNTERTILESAKIQRQILAHNDLGLTEVLALPSGAQMFVNTEEDFLKAIGPFMEKGNVYLSINPRGKEEGSAESVSYLTAIVLDFDPVRAKDTSSSPEQHLQATQIAQRVGGSYPHSVVVDSGSGSHVYIPVRPVKITNENREEITARLKAFKDKIKAEYETPEIKVDHICDLPRRIRVWGSWNAKSNRPCQPLNRWDGVRTDFDSLTKDLPVESIQAKQSASGAIPAAKDSITQRFEKFLVANPSIKRLIETAGENYDSRSEAAFRLISGLVGAAFSDNEILQVHNEVLPHKKGDKWTLDDIKRIRSKQNERQIKALDSEYIRSLDDRKMGLTTGFSRLDSSINGYNRGRLIVIAAEPGTGKTTLAVQQGYEIAKQGHPVLMFPTESSRANVFDKIVSREADISLRKFQLGKFTDEERQKINDEAKKIAQQPFFVVEDFNLKIERVEEDIKTLMPDVVILDYLQGMTFPNGGDSLELGNVVIQCKRMAQQYKLSFVLLSQLNRGEGLKLSRLNGTGKLEQQGDDIILLHCTDESKTVYPRPVDAHVKKAKYGEPGVIQMKFWSSVCKFEEN